MTGRNRASGLHVTRALMMTNQLGEFMYERKSIAILWWESDLLNRSRWTLRAKVTWSEYQQYAKSMTGEGTSWKAVLL